MDEQRPIYLTKYNAALNNNIVNFLKNIHERHPISLVQNQIW